MPLSPWLYVGVLKYSTGQWWWYSYCIVCFTKESWTMPREFSLAYRLEFPTCNSTAGDRPREKRPYVWNRRHNMMKSLGCGKRCFVYRTSEPCIKFKKEKSIAIIRLHLQLIDINTINTPTRSLWIFLTLGREQCAPDCCEHLTDICTHTYTLCLHLMFGHWETRYCNKQNNDYYY